MTRDRADDRVIGNRVFAFCSGSVFSPSFCDGGVPTTLVGFGDGVIPWMRFFFQFLV